MGKREFYILVAGIGVEAVAVGVGVMVSPSWGWAIAGFGGGIFIVFILLAVKAKTIGSPADILARYRTSQRVFTSIAGQYRQDNPAQERIRD